MVTRSWCMLVLPDLHEFFLDDEGRNARLRVQSLDGPIRANRFAVPKLNPFFCELLYLCRISPKIFRIYHSASCG